jgi:DNA polymerase III epsilon subunit family exonuclease
VELTSLGNSESVLTTRAADFLAAGPADAQSLITYVCQLPSAPAMVAEHMATALFAGHRRFTRELDGRWRLLETRPGAVRRATIAESSFIVVDVETTGSSIVYGDRITEVAAVLVHRGEMTTLVESLVNPERPIPPQVTRLTNITSSMVKRAPRFADVCDQLLGALEGRVFVAHNARFDWRFLSLEVERATGRPLAGRQLCTVKMLRRFVPQLRRRSLDWAARHFDVEILNRHRAGGDARATARVLIRLLREAEDAGCITLDDLDRQLRLPPNRKKRKRRPPAMPHSASDDSSA